MSKKILMYMHAGSGNHGCEAIVNSTCHLLVTDEENKEQQGTVDKTEQTELSVLTNDQTEDERYSLGGLCNLIQEQNLQEHFLAHVLYYGYRKLTGDRESFLAYKYRKAGRLSDYDLALSIGGDNYCYDNMLEDLMLSNSLFHKKGLKTILLGCSIEPELLKRPDIVADLKSYAHIITRESITTNALKHAGIEQVTQLPDPAFSLKPISRQLPPAFEPGNTVGINVSPMIMDYEAKGQTGIVWDNYVALMQYILEETEYHVALITHVVWERNDDRKPVQKLYEQFREVYGDRLCVLQDGTCQELKGDISRCRFFVGARTHATIAAYSTCVPTLVAGYSVKSVGIAKDLFGEEENYVVDVRTLEDEQALTRHFRKLESDEEHVRELLWDRIPAYVEELQKLNGIVNCYLK